MPPIPLISALARLRISVLSISRILSRIAYAYLLAGVANLEAFFKVLKKFIVWLAGQPAAAAHRLRKLLNKLVHGRKRALLIGIQQVAEPPLEGTTSVLATTKSDASLAPESSLAPGRPRGMKKHVKGTKSKSKSRKQKQEASLETQTALKGPHRDVKAMRALLIDKYGFDPDNIVVLIDDGDSTHPQPTRDNILLQIRNLVKDVQDGDKLFFHYAGHADQEDTDDIEEEDGKNEFLLSSDGFQIMDNELKLEMVDPLLTVKCTLTAVLDCCHSGSLLDLPHARCNDVYVPWMNKGRRRTKTLWADLRREDGMHTPPESVVPPPINLNILAVMNSNKENKKPQPLFIDIAASYPTPPQSHISRHPSFSDNVHVPAIDIVEASPTEELASFVSPARFAKSPVALYAYCEGTCRDSPFHRCDGERTGVEVICISAAKDSELAWEDGMGRSMTQYLVQNLSTKPKPTLQTLMTAISHDIHSYYVSELHQKARAFKKKLNARNNGKVSEDTPGFIVEMHNFQNPQLSSLIPMNMDQLFDP